MGTCKSQCCGDKATTHNLDFDVETNNMSGLNPELSHQMIQESRNFKNELSNISQINDNGDNSLNLNDKEEEQLIFSEQLEEDNSAPNSGINN
jgi:hypothetical protein